MVPQGRHRASSDDPGARDFDDARFGNNVGIRAFLPHGTHIVQEFPARIDASSSLFAPSHACRKLIRSCHTGGGGGVVPESFWFPV